MDSTPWLINVVTRRVITLPFPASSEPTRRLEPDRGGWARAIFGSRDKTPLSPLVTAGVAPAALPERARLVCQQPLSRTAPYIRRYALDRNLGETRGRLRRGRYSPLLSNNAASQSQEKAKTVHWRILLFYIQHSIPLSEGTGVHPIFMSR